MEHRLFGVETEYGVRLLKPDRRAGDLAASISLSGEIARRLEALFRCRKHSFQQNGSRIYLDANKRMEYSSAECERLSDLPDHVRAGDELMADAVPIIEDRLREEFPGYQLFISRDNVDLKRNHWASHENYSFEGSNLNSANLDAAAQNLCRSIAPHLVTRQIFSGGGGLLIDSGRTRFVVSPRGAITNDWSLDSATGRNLGMIKLGQDHHSGDETGRLQVVCGDSNVSETALALRIGTTRLVLAIAEADPLAFHGLALVELIASLQRVATLGNDARLTLLLSGKTISPLQHQQEVFELCANAAQTGLVSDDEASILPAWSENLSVLEKDPEEAERRFDHLALQKLFRDHNLLSDDSNLIAAGMLPRATVVDLRYHDIGPHGLRQRMEECNWLRRITDPEEVANAKTTPPSGGRAEIRGEFRKRVDTLKLDEGAFTMDWERIELYGQPTWLDRHPTTAQRLQWEKVAQRLDEKARRIGASLD